MFPDIYFFPGALAGTLLDIAQKIPTICPPQHFSCLLFQYIRVDRASGIDIFARFVLQRMNKEISIMSHSRTILPLKTVDRHFCMTLY